MSHDHDKEKLIEKYYPDAEHRVVLDYIAKRAATEVMDQHKDHCPFEQKVYSMAGKAALGFLALLVMVGAVIYGSVKARVP
jgi:hypothetical protein